MLGLLGFYRFLLVLFFLLGFYRHFYGPFLLLAGTWFTGGQSGGLSVRVEDVLVVAYLDRHHERGVERRAVLVVGWEEARFKRGVKGTRIPADIELRLVVGQLAALDGRRARIVPVSAATALGKPESVVPHRAPVFLAHSPVKSSLSLHLHRATNHWRVGKLSAAMLFLPSNLVGSDLERKVVVRLLRSRRNVHGAKRLGRLQG